jgi:hypothetical protein
MSTLACRLPRTLSRARRHERTGTSAPSRAKADDASGATPGHRTEPLEQIPFASERKRAEIFVRAMS